MIEAKDKKGLHTLNQWFIKDWKRVAKISEVYMYSLSRYHNFGSFKFTLNFTNRNISLFLLLSFVCFFSEARVTYIYFYFLVVEIRGCSERFEIRKDSEIR